MLLPAVIGLIIGLQLLFREVSVYLSCVRRKENIGLCWLKNIYRWNVEGDLRPISNILSTLEQFV